MYFSQMKLGQDPKRSKESVALKLSAEMQKNGLFSMKTLLTSYLVGCYIYMAPVRKPFVLQQTLWTHDGQLSIINHEQET